VQRTQYAALGKRYAPSIEFAEQARFLAELAKAVHTAKTILQRARQILPNAALFAFTCGASPTYDWKRIAFRGGFVPLDSVHKAVWSAARDDPQVLAADGVHWSDKGTPLPDWNLHASCGLGL
jgi:hypothetical protein